jgi:hypothetical protein
MDYFRRACTIETALCELDTKSALRVLIDWYGVQLFDERFYQHLVDEGIIGEETK